MKESLKEIKRILNGFANEEESLYVEDAMNKFYDEQVILLVAKEFHLAKKNKDMIKCCNLEMLVQILIYNNNIGINYHDKNCENSFIHTPLSYTLQNKMYDIVVPLLSREDLDVNMPYYEDGEKKSILNFLYSDYNALINTDILRNICQHKKFEHNNEISNIIRDVVIKMISHENIDVDYTFLENLNSIVNDKSYIHRLKISEKK